MKTALVLALALAAAGGSAAFGQARIVGPAGTTYSMAVTTWRDMPFRRVVRQQYDFSCGSAAVATLLTFHYRRPTTETEAFKAMYERGDQAKIRKVGFSMLDMRNYLASVGVKADGYRLTIAELAKLKIPAIALIQIEKYKHFVVIKGVRGDQVVVGDPALGERAISTAEFNKMWNGVALAVNPDAARGAFNRPEDWELRPGAPWREGVSPNTIADFTSQLSPLYQLRPAISVVTHTP